VCVIHNERDFGYVGAGYPVVAADGEEVIAEDGDEGRARRGRRW
jgi:hypothetical protein